MFLGLLLVICGTAFAGHRDSDLRLSVFQNQLFTVKINASRASAPVTQITLRDLTPGNHWIEVRTVGVFSTRPLYRGNIHVKANSRIKARIDRSGNFVIKEVIRKGRCGTPTVQQGGFYGGSGSGSFGGHFGSATCGTASPQGPYGVYQGSQVGNFGGSVHVTAVMGHAEFRQLINRLQAQRFDNVRTDMALNAINRNSFTSAQIRDILLTIDFENNRLDVAIAGFASVVNPQNYHTVNTAFRYNSTVDKLWRSI